MLSTPLRTAGTLQRLGGTWAQSTRRRFAGRRRPPSSQRRWTPRATPASLWRFSVSNRQQHGAASAQNPVACAARPRTAGSTAAAPRRTRRPSARGGGCSPCAGRAPRPAAAVLPPRASRPSAAPSVWPLARTATKSVPQPRPDAGPAAGPSLCARPSANNQDPVSSTQESKVCVTLKFPQPGSPVRGQARLHNRRLRALASSPFQGGLRHAAQATGFL
jgi:hypothetical protein